MADISELKKHQRWKKLLLACAAVLALVAGVLYSQREVVKEVPFTDYLSDLEHDRVKKIEVHTEFLQQILTVELKAPAAKIYKVTAPHLNLESATALSKKGVKIIYPPEGFNYTGLMHKFMTALIIAYLLFMLYQFFPGGISLGRSAPRVKARFSDIAGAVEAKTAVQEIVEYLKDPRAFKQWGARFPSGIMLSGPPGNGKTLLARAVAGEADAAFIAVSSADFNSPFLGMAGIKIKRIFARAKSMAPCIIFIDEIDGIGGVRMSEGTAAAREMGSTLTQLLVQMDGFEPNSGIVVIAATNRVDSLDPALVRSGRFDRTIHVHTPTLTERQEILVIHSKSLPLAPHFCHATVARASIGMSGADLANLMNQAALLAKRGAAAWAAPDIKTEHALQARDRMLMGDARDSLRALLDAPTRRVLAVHEASHAVACMAFGHDRVTGVSILPRGLSLGQTQMTPESDRLLHDRNYLLAQLRILAAGRVGEELFEGACTTGAENDIARMTDIAHNMVRRFGMGALGMMRVDKMEGGTLTDKVNADILKLVRQAKADAQVVLAANRQVVAAIAEVLLDREEASAAEMQVYAASMIPITGLCLNYPSAIAPGPWI